MAVNGEYPEDSDKLSKSDKLLEVGLSEVECINLAHYKVDLTMELYLRTRDL